ncbi:MAG: hypothetical protein FJX73_05505 [Armatimonadetes bacterium]|nr:hypothetical protein [Armatimonadota bacterium]
MPELELNTQDLPTHLTRVAARLRLVGPDASGDTFLLTSYLFEASLKTIAIALWSGLRGSSAENAYAVAYRLVRADGLGEWEDSIYQMSSQPLAGYLSPVFQPTINWLTQKRKPPADDWFLAAIGASDRIISFLGLEPDSDVSRYRTIRHLLKSLVLIRNKTKAHGAVGPEFFQMANPHYLTAVSAIAVRCPLFRARWMHLSIRVSKNTVRGVDLVGPEPRHIRDAECEEFSPTVPGVHVALARGIQPFYVGEFLRTTVECKAFLLPNGGFTTANGAEFIDFANGETERLDLPAYALPPAPLPPSETEGLPDLDIQSNVFGNLPPRPHGYVERPQLQGDLLTRLLDRNHPIITLHGRGGIGKTSLALWAAHELASRAEPPFSFIVWFSARDVDLRPTGPAPVRTAVVDLKSVSRVYGAMFATKPSEDAFARMLQAPQPDGTGRLLIFDNFETFADSRQLHRFLDTHTHLPNKVLMTSRERAFKADYPIEVRGMEPAEARSLLASVGRELGIEGLLNDDAVESIYRYTDGHPYVMRLVLGEMAKERRYVPPKDLLPRRIDIVNAVFERSFNKLSQHGKWVYLLTANWRTAIAELALVVICAERDVDAEAGAEECVRLSLLTAEQTPAGSYYYWAPELARVFGRKKLDSDPDRLAIQQALADLRRFCVLKPGQVATTSHSDVVNRFLESALEDTSSTDAQEIDRLNGILERIAELYPPAWGQVAAFRRHFRLPGQDIEYALRRWVEEQPFDKTAWLQRAEYAREVSDQETQISSLVSAVDADPRDISLLRDAALALCQFIDARKAAIPRTRRGVYLAGVRDHMERSAGDLDATALSRLAWLFLLEDNREKALYYAKLGLDKEPGNEHCRRIVQRLEPQAGRPTRR